jgi:hypothetical protein
MTKSRLLALEHSLTLVQTENAQLKFQVDYNAFAVTVVIICGLIIGICLYSIKVKCC